MALIDPRQLLIPGYDRPQSYRQPEWPLELDFSNDLLFGCISLVCGADPSGYPFDLIRGIRASVLMAGSSGAGPLPIAYPTVCGVGLRHFSNTNFDIGSNYGFTDPTYYRMGSGDSTYFYAFISSGAVAQIGILSSTQNSAAPYYGHQVSIGDFNNNNGHVYCNILDGTGGGSPPGSIDTGMFITHGILQTVVTVRDGNTIRAFVNGANCGVTGALTGSTDDPSASELALNIGSGNMVVGPNIPQFFYDGLIYIYGAVRGRAWGAKDAARFHRAPFSIYKPQVKKTWFFPAPPAAGGGISIAEPAGSLTLTGFAPSVSVTANQTIAVPAGSLTETGQAPTVLTPQTIAVPAASLALTGLAPTIAVSNNQAVAVPAGALAETGQAPTVAVSANQTVSPPAGALTETGLAPSLQLGTRIDVPAGALSLIGKVPTLLTPQTIGVPAGTLVLTGLVPTAAAGGNQAVTIPAGALAETGFAPSLILPQLIAVPPGALVETSFIPAIGATGNLTISVAAGTLILTGFAPGSQDRPGRVTASDRSSTIATSDRSSTLAATNRTAGSISGTSS